MNLIPAIQDLADGLNKAEQIDCILLEFSKALDKIPHQQLAKDYEYDGVKGCTLVWIKNFLHQRTPREKYSKEKYGRALELHMEFHRGRLWEL